MKIRAGFVSNSSTSSFVLIGFDASNLGLNMDDIYSEMYDFDYITSSEGGAPDGVDLVIGKFLLTLSSESSWVASEIYDIGDVVTNVRAIKKELGGDAPIKIYTGMMLS